MTQLSHHKEYCLFLIKNFLYSKEYSKKFQMLLNNLFTVQDNNIILSDVVGKYISAIFEWFHHFSNFRISFHFTLCDCISNDNNYLKK